MEGEGWRRPGREQALSEPWRRSWRSPVEGGGERRNRGRFLGDSVEGGAASAGSASNGQEEARDGCARELRELRPWRAALRSAQVEAERGKGAGQGSEGESGRVASRYRGFLRLEGKPGQEATSASASAGHARRGQTVAAAWASGSGEERERRGVDTVYGPEPMTGGAKGRGEGVVHGTEFKEGGNGFPKPGADSGFRSTGI